MKRLILSISLCIYMGTLIPCENKCSCTNNSSYTGFSVACFLLKQDPKTANQKDLPIQHKLNILSQCWKKTDPMFPLKKNDADWYDVYENDIYTDKQLSKLYKKIKMFRSLHKEYLKFATESDPDWSLFANTIKQHPFASLVWALRLGDFLSYDDTFLNNIAQQAYRKLSNKSELFMQHKKVIKKSKFRIEQTSFEKLGTFVCTEENIDKGPMAYTHATINFFAEANTILLPVDGFVTRIKLVTDEFDNKTLVNTKKLENGTISMLKQKTKAPFMCIKPDTGFKIASVGAYTFITNKNGRVLIQVNNRDLLSCNCTKLKKQLVITNDYAVCVSTAFSSSENKNIGIIIDFKTGQHYFLHYTYPQPMFSYLKMPSSQKPTIHHTNGLICIQWPNIIECFELSSGLHSIYRATDRIAHMDISPDGQHLIICEEKSETYTYHIFRINKKYVSFSGQLQTILPKPKPTSLDAIWSFFDFSKKNLFTVNSIFEPKN